MKKILLLSLLLLCILPFTPWYIIALAMGFNGWTSPSKKEALISGGIITSIAWLLPLIWGYFSGGKLLMERVSTMLGIPHPLLLICISILLISVVGLLSSLSGYFSRKVVNEFSF
ncbi:MAG: hypothetical protein QGF57_05085 [Candidatus Marinimicrobia bacterium]|nr:hypothetical protein [Candidatus Neomarinimicrobiota bacterium]